MPRYSQRGNYGTGTDLQKEDAAAINTYCEKYGCEFMLTLGDNFYDGNWTKAFSELSVAS